MIYKWEKQLYGWTEAYSKYADFVEYLGKVLLQNIYTGKIDILF